MKTVIQRVANAMVVVEGKTVGSIGKGLVVLVGFEADDTMRDDIEWLCHKIVYLRIFNDSEGLMNHSVLDIGGDILLVSQFTLQASTKKGNRPSFVQAAKPEIAMPLYEKTIEILSQKMEKNIQTGIFGADMKLTLLNDGPVTITIDTKHKI